VSQRKRNPYARTYLISTDGSAALKAPEAMETSHMKRKDTTSQKKPVMLIVPVYVLLSAAAACAFLFAILLLNMSSEASQIQKDIHDLRQSEIRAREVIGSLEVQILQAEAPENIHSIAVNRLGMRRPTEDEIIFIPFSGQFAPADAEESPVPEQTSLWRYLVGLLGF